MGKDRDKKDKRNINSRSTRGTLKIMLFCVTFGTIVGILLAKFLVDYYGHMDGKAMTVLYSGLAMCLFSIILHIIIHEAGHLVFGLLTGYSFLSFRVFSLTIMKEENRFVCRKLSIPGTSGQCLMAPPEVSAEKLPYRLYNYGGVILNFLVSFLALLPMLLVDGLPMFTVFLLGGFAAAGIMLGALNGIPLKSFGMANDGYNVKSIQKDPAAKRSFQKQLELVVKQSAGIRLKDMPAEWFELPEGADLTNVMHAFIQYIVYNRNLDRLDFDAAGESLTKLLPALPKLPMSCYNTLNLELLFLALLRRDFKDGVEQYYTKQSKLLIKSAKNEINIRRVAYAYYKLYEKDDKAAELCRKKLIGLADKYPFPAEAEMNLMLADYVDKISRDLDEIL